MVFARYSIWSSAFDSLDQRNFVCRLSESFIYCFGNFRFPSNHSVKKGWLTEGCWDGRSSSMFSPSLQRTSEALSEWPSGSWQPLGRVLVPDFFHFRIIKATVLLGTLKPLEIVLYTGPDLCLTTKFHSRVSQRVLRSSWYIFFLTFSVNYGAFYTQDCVALNYV